MFRVDLKCISTVWHKMLNHNIPYNILNTKKIVFLLKTRLNIWFRINCSNHQKEANGGTWNIPSKYIHIRLKKTWVNFINQSVVQFIHISVYQSFCNYLSKVGMLSELHCIFNKILALAEKERGFVVLQAHTFFSMQSWAVIQPHDCLELGKEPLWKSSKEMLLWNRQVFDSVSSIPKDIKSAGGKTLVVIYYGKKEGKLDNLRLTCYQELYAG